MKHTRWARFFETLIFTILLTLPIINVFVRSIYVQSNDNAKDSYNNQLVVENVSNVTDFVVGKRYRYYNNQLITSATSSGPVSNNYFTYTDVELVVPLSNDSYNSTILNSVKLGLYKTNGTTYISLFFYDSSNNVNSFSTGNGYFVFEFTLTSLVYNLDFLTFFTTTPFVLYDDTNTLDNVFEYSISKTIDDFGSGNINFVNWLGDLMFDDVNTNIYFNFVNMWFNYSLVICVAHFLWYVLYWFIKQGRELIYSFSIKEK